MKTVVVTGTPGTGKTTIAKKLANKLNFYYVDVNQIISKDWETSVTKSANWMEDRGK